jgi:hypothetical protein
VESAACKPFILLQCSESITKGHNSFSWDLAAFAMRHDEACAYNGLQWRCVQTARLCGLFTDLPSTVGGWFAGNARPVVAALPAAFRLFPVLNAHFRQLPCL